MLDPGISCEDVCAPIDLSLEVDRFRILLNHSRLAGLERREDIRNDLSCRGMEIDEVINDVSQLLGIEIGDSVSYSRGNIMTGREVLREVVDVGQAELGPGVVDGDKGRFFMMEGTRS